MKSAKFFASLLLLVCSLSFFSCTKQSDLLTDTKDILVQGQWKVDYYFSDQDHTTQFSDYSFQFLPNGTLTCSDTKYQYTGTWQMIRNMNQSDWLSINLTPVSPDLQQLNLSWKISQVNLNTIGFVSEGARPYQLRIAK